MTALPITPGPWGLRVEPYEDDPFPGRDFVLISVGEDKLQGIIRPEDAKAIAAAPEMVKVLRAVRYPLFAGARGEFVLADCKRHLEAVNAALKEAGIEL